MKKHDPKFLVDLLKKNVDNEKLDDASFREFVRTSLDLYRSSDDEESDDLMRIDDCTHIGR